ncbi:MAG: RNA 2'-phosphotransferase [Deltaproteobacteria bacterium]|nr:RNA 2'-phosphotransferase [Deltaproteobacteria bacterium]
MLTYILAHRPDEFGLVPDKEGFVRYKDLLKALHEESEWRHVRISHINEMLMGEDRALFETESDRIRSRERRWVLNSHGNVPLPGLLYTPVRKKAHRVAMERGLKAKEGSYVALSADRKMARRMGRRRDQNPVLLEVPAVAAEKKRVMIFPFGDLFLAPEIPAECISGPLPSKDLSEKEEKKVGKKQKSSPEIKTATPGSFILDPQRDPDPSRKSKGKKRKGWKEETRKMRRKQKRYGSPIHP